MAQVEGEEREQAQEREVAAEGLSMAAEAEGGDAQAEAEGGDAQAEAEAVAGAALQAQEGPAPPPGPPEGAPLPDGWTKEKIREQAQAAVLGNMTKGKESLPPSRRDERATAAARPSACLSSLTLPPPGEVI